MFGPDDICSCKVLVCNAEGYAIEGHPLFVILDVYGMYFFGPSFSQEFDNYLASHPVFYPGLAEVEVIPAVHWPSGVGSATGIRWLGALTDPQISQLFGKMDVCEFGWYE